VCIIDEIDKMDAKDRVAMHEALEQQTISIAKAGIVATLNARCAVLAAANPAFGRYLPNRTVAENVDLPVTLLSRFDLIFIIRDQPMLEQDKKVAEHVTTLHSGELPPEFRDIIPPDLLRKYIAYARKYVKPRWTKDAKEIIMQFYINLRAKSSDPNSPIAITARQLEALIRLAEAEAKMRLSPLVEREDAERAIMLFEKFLKSVGIDVETGKIDIDIIMTGKPRSKQEKFAVLRDIIAKLEEANGGKPVKIEDVIKEAESAGLDRQTVEQMLNLMIKNGDLYMPRHGYIKRVST
ncbi:MAG: minichromosome maintenance protein MCM, partial [Crenarchaeota archaeon]|nr:minichromosome maintenance protein MCM [Thermoproteota archaeon]